MTRIRLAAQFALSLALLLALPLGCGGLATSDSMAKQEAEPGWGGAPMVSGPASGELDRSAYWDDGLAEVAKEDLASGGDFGGGMDGDGEGYRGEPVTSAAEGRKLIRTGLMTVVVEDYEPFHSSLDQRVKELGGFVADASLSHYAGNVSWATLTIRIPADHFEDLVGWAESEVEVQALDIGTQDVTEEWVDVRSRIDNGKRTEARLLELLDDRTADLEDVLAVEREIARVRQEIEHAEGRMRVLADQVALATLTLSVSVRNPYEPAVDPPGFGQLIADTFHGSINAMVTVGKALVLVATAAAPWLLLLSIFCYVCYRILRRLLRRKSA